MLVLSVTFFSFGVSYVASSRNLFLEPENSTLGAFFRSVLQNLSNDLVCACEVIMTPRQRTMMTIPTVDPSVGCGDALVLDPCCFPIRLDAMSSNEFDQVAS